MTAATIFEVSDVIKVSLIDNFSALDRWLMVVEKDQMPYAIARAFTDMAQLGKATITHDIPVKKRQQFVVLLLSPVTW